MNRKALNRSLLILVPLGLLLFQIFFPIPHNKTKTLHLAMKAVVPPIVFVFHYFDFNEKNALSRWEEKMFDGKVAYWVEFDQQSGFVRSKSQSAASAIFYKLKYNIQEYPFISWKWRVGKFPDKSQVTDPKKRDDFAARFYVVFHSRFFTNFKCLEYVWDEELKEGTILESPYSDQIKQLVIQTGPSGKDWVLEERNVVEDYQKLFGEKPSLKVGAIALMTDSEGTQGEAEAFFDDIRIGKKERAQ